MNGSKPGQLQLCSPQKAARGYLKLRESGNYNPACNSPDVTPVTSFFSSSQDTSCSNSSTDFSTFVQLYQHENNLVCRYIVLCLEVIFADDFRIQWVFLPQNSMQQNKLTPWTNKAITKCALFPHSTYMLQHWLPSAETQRNKNSQLEHWNIIAFFIKICPLSGTFA